MIDIHNHLIYQFDDGPQSLDESLEMLRSAAGQGITAVFATSHFNESIPQEMEDDYFAKLKILRQEVREREIGIEVYSGAEVFYHHNMAETAKSSKVGTLAGLGQYILLEFPLMLLPSGVEETLFKLRMDEFIPIIAHPERYSVLFDQPEKLLNYMEHGALLQVNVGSVVGQFGKKVQRVALDLLERRAVHFLGSDAHSSRVRNFKLAEAAKFLEKYLDADYIEELTETNAQWIIENERLEIARYQELPSENGFLHRFFKKFKSV